MAYLDSCHYQFDKYSTYDCMVAVSNKAAVFLSDKDLLQKEAFEYLKFKVNKKPGWWFGGFSYDLKNQIEKLHSRNFDGLHMPELFFFQPEILFKQQKGKWSIEIFNEKLKFEDIINQVQDQTQVQPTIQKIPLIKNRINESEYLKTFKKIKQDIINGTYYELNFCREFYAENVQLNPLRVFKQLSKQTAAPMSAFIKIKNQYILSASPERFLKKQGEQLIAQPMKGTCKRGSTKKEDEVLKKQLQQSIKERAENIMIVDLMRNDLTKSAQLGSIEVENLFQIQSFKGFHTMISTVKAKINKGVHWVDVIKNAFPIGSMTGAPKVKVMQHIEAYEKTKRGFYAGAVGYFTPHGDFDFNVIIRSILYNADNQYLSFQTGGAIVYDSMAEQEWEETNLKAENIFLGLTLNH